MPYIRDELRPEIDDAIDGLVEVLFDQMPGNRPGALNYTITRLVSKLCAPNSNYSYEQLMAAIGTFECAKLELYRRVGGPKEDKAIADNGDTEEYAKATDIFFPGDCY